MFDFVRDREKFDSYPVNIILQKIPETESQMTAHPIRIVHLSWCLFHLDRSIPHLCIASVPPMFNRTVLLTPCPKRTKTGLNNGVFSHQEIAALPRLLLLGMYKLRNFGSCLEKSNWLFIEDLGVLVQSVCGNILFFATISL